MLSGITLRKGIKVKKAVVDIDNTLWHFCDVLHEKLKRINPSFPPPQYWIHWDFWMRYCSEEEFMAAIRSIHLNQDDDSHKPYAGAGRFLACLRENDFHIVIASHRATESLDQTERWLLKHNLVFDDIYLSFDKTVLFDNDCRVVVDDSPSVLEKATEKKILASGLSFPWNREHVKGCRLFSNLKEVLSHILERAGTDRW